MLGNDDFFLQSTIKANMSRKAREDKSSWKIPSVYTFVGAYGPFRGGNKNAGIEDAMVYLYNSSVRQDPKHHSMHAIAGQAQRLLLEKSNGNRTLFVIDLNPMFDEDTETDYETSLRNEASKVELTKRFGKVILRLLQRLRLRNAELIAEGSLCCLLWKLYWADPTLWGALCMIQTKLSKDFVNTHLVVSSPTTPTSDIPLRFREPQN